MNKRNNNVKCLTHWGQEALQAIFARSGWFLAVMLAVLALLPLSVRVADLFDLSFPLVIAVIDCPVVATQRIRKRMCYLFLEKGMS